MAHTEPLTQENPVSPDGLLRWNGHGWVANHVEDSGYGPEKLATLTEAEKNQLAEAVRPEELGWYADPLSDGSSARLWSGSEWTAIVRRKLPATTSTISSTAPLPPGSKGQPWSTNKKLIAAFAAVVVLIIGGLAVAASSGGQSSSDSSPAQGSIEHRTATERWDNMGTFDRTQMARLFAAEGSEPYARDLADKNDSVDYESWREIARTLESKASAWVQAEGIDLADDSEFEASAQAANRSVEYWWTELDYGERQTYCLMRSSDPDSIYEAAERNLAPLYGSESSEWIAAALSNHLDYVC